MLSTGEFHQRFVPLERVIEAATAAAAASLPTRISVEICDQQTLDESFYGEQLRNIPNREMISMGYDPWLVDTGGRGRETISHERYLACEDEDPSFGRCEQIFDTISITPKGRLVACCGYPLEELPGLQIGSITDAALNDVLSTSPDDLLKIALHVIGPRGIESFVKNYDDSFKLPPAALICQICAQLQKSPDAMSVIAQHLAEFANLVVGMFLTLQSTNRSTLVGPETAR
jgi:hypothetical protein